MEGKQNMRAALLDTASSHQPWILKWDRLQARICCDADSLGGLQCVQDKVDNHLTKEVCPERQMICSGRISES